MTAHSLERGHRIEWRGDGWRYADNGQPITGTRICVRCHRPPHSDGRDACMSFMPGVASACCGHGVTPPFRVEALTGSKEAEGVDIDAAKR